MIGFSLSGFAQIPTPAKEQTGFTVVTGGTIHVGNGDVIEQGSLLITGGKIISIAQESDSGFSRGIDSLITEGQEVEVIEVEGDIYPGLIAPNTQLGLKEIDLVRASRDYREVGVNNANVRAIIAYNTESKILPTVKYNGVLIAEIAPEGNLITGQSSIVELDAWNWEDAAYKTDLGIHIRWPSWRFNEKAREQRRERVQTLDAIFVEAKAYSKTSNPEIVNIKHEAMRGLFDGSKKAFVHANRASDIVESVQFMERHGVEVVIIGGSQSAQVVSFLKKHEVPIVFSRTQKLPTAKDAAYDEIYATPKLLQDSGVLFCIADQESWQQRNLPFQAGTAVAFGLTKEQALAAVTSNTAKIYGLSSLGTLEIGKDATLVVSKGDILDMRGNNITLAMIRGKKLDMTNHQEELYKKYRAKYQNSPD